MSVIVNTYNFMQQPKKEKLWEKVLEEIMDNTTPISFATWFKSIKLVGLDRSNRIAYLDVGEPERELRGKIIAERYISLMEAAFFNITHERYTIIVD